MSMIQGNKSKLIHGLTNVITMATLFRVTGFKRVNTYTWK